MAETDFEFALERMFAEAPAMPDADLFALRVMDRLDRGWALRRLLIGGAGALGGVIGAAQLLGSGALWRLQALGVQSNAYFADHLARLGPVSIAPEGAGLDIQTLMMVGTLAVVAAALGLARLIREL